MELTPTLVAFAVFALLVVLVVELAEFVGGVL